MKLKLERKYFKPDYTLGYLFVDGFFFSDTMELPWQDNISNISCIPTGVYKVRLDYSPKHGRVLPCILNVPNRTNIEIHNGSYPSDTLGCVLCGRNTVKGMLTSSRFLTNMLVNLLTPQTDIEIEIV
jgi:hypothetical protein